ncbi:MAG: hypothetical protein ACT4PV_07575 [Planctomycetaceae bacterium]
MAAKTPVLRTLGMLLLAAWGVLFLAAALGELLDIDALRGFADLKRIFLR